VTHPVVLAALALLLANDHVLKRAWPGLVTGKLSDVAGPIVVAALAGAVARRRGPRWERAAWVAVAVAFALVKAVPRLNAAVPLAGVADPWDVLGLVALPFAWRATRRPPPWRPRVVWRAAAVAVAVVAISATSRAVPPSVDRVRVEDGVLRAYGTTGWNEAYEWVSRDGGGTWERTAEPPLVTEITSEPPSPPPRTPPLPPAHTRACAGARCYDVAGGAVRQSDDHGRTWHAATGLPNDRVVAADVAFAGDTVAIAAGEDGVLRRDGDGRWSLRHPDDDFTGRDDSPLPFLLWAAAFGALGLLIALGLCWLVLKVLDRLTRASRQARTEEADVWSPPLPRTRSSPRRSPRYRQ
jgi:hypothetical protein